MHHADRELGRLQQRTAELVGAERLLTVIAADHGEGLLDHGFRNHGVYLYEEQVRIPLLLHWPGTLSPRRVAAPVSLVDVAPTLLELLGLAVHERVAGVSLAAVTMGRDEGRTTDRAIFMQRRDYATGVADGVAVKGRKLAVRRGPYKLIVADEEDTTELFDLDTDPRELDNLAARKPDVVRQLRAQLDAWQGAAKARRPGRELEPSDVEALRALGYVR